MKLSKSVLLSTVLLSSTLLLPITTLAADGGTYHSNGRVLFTPNDQPTSPENPLNPGEDIKPENPDGTDPEPGTAGPLSIDFASSFDFGEQKISSKDETYYAAPQKHSVTDKDGKVTEGTTANYIQVSDNRGSEAGWTLSVTQVGQFKTADSHELTSAAIVLDNAAISSKSDPATMPKLEQTTLELVPGTQHKLMSAASGKGSGTFMNFWGNDTQKDKSVYLTVPGSTTKYAKEYTTTLEWTLEDTPGSED